jgi:hypothetical protein
LPNIVVTISLDTERDRDILRWLKRQQNRSAAVRQAIRHSLCNGVTIGDLYETLQEIKRDLRTRILAAPETQAQEDDWPSEDAGAAAALSKLGEIGSRE